MDYILGTIAVFLTGLIIWGIFGRKNKEKPVDIRFDRYDPIPPPPPVPTRRNGSGPLTFPNHPIVPVKDMEYFRYPPATIKNKPVRSSIPGTTKFGSPRANYSSTRSKSNDDGFVPGYVSGGLVTDVSPSHSSKVDIEPGGGSFGGAGSSVDYGSGNSCDSGSSCGGSDGD